MVFILHYAIPHACKIFILTVASYQGFLQRNPTGELQLDCSDHTRDTSNQTVTEYNYEFIGLILIFFDMMIGLFSITKRSGEDMEDYDIEDDLDIEDDGLELIASNKREDELFLPADGEKGPEIFWATRG